MMTSLTSNVTEKKMTELEALKAQIKVLERKVEQLERNTLYSIIEGWWSDVFTVSSTDDMETCIDTLVDRIETWLPKEQSAAGSQNVYVECSVEGFNARSSANDCLDLHALIRTADAENTSSFAANIGFGARGSACR